MPNRSYIYIALAGEDKIIGGTLDSDSGAIELKNEIQVLSGPEALAIDPKKQFLFVGCHLRYHKKNATPNESGFYSYRVDWTDGKLIPINHVSLKFAPTYLSVDRKSRFILSAYYRSGKAAVHRINEVGEIGKATQWFDSGGGAHCLQVDPTNKFAFLPHVTSSKVNINTWPPLISPNHILPSASNTILQFKFDDENGILSPNSPFKLPGERGGGPRHYVFHPRLNILYFSNEQGCAVTTYSLNVSNGTLTPCQYISTLPSEGYDHYASCSALCIAHSGRFLYVLNRGFDTIACYTIDPVTGRLTSNGLVPTEAQSHALDIDPDDKYLFVAGHESGCLATYRVLDNGKLEQLGSRPIGKRPKWILITRKDS